MEGCDVPWDLKACAVEGGDNIYGESRIPTLVEDFTPGCLKLILIRRSAVVYG
jgi:hypothetical protein